jgi:hypothetical protein
MSTFIRTRTITPSNGKLLCSCSFFKHMLLCRYHLYVVLQRGPLPTDCITRWPRDYLAFCYWGGAKVGKEFGEAKRMEVDRPIYVKDEALPQEYPVVIILGRGKGYRVRPSRIRLKQRHLTSTARGNACWMSHHLRRHFSNDNGKDVFSLFFPKTRQRYPALFFGNDLGKAAMFVLL